MRKLTEISDRGVIVRVVRVRCASQVREAGGWIERTGEDGLVGDAGEGKMVVTQNFNVGQREAER